jgi:hypothetical protein
MECILKHGRKIQMKSELNKREEINFKQIYGRDPFKETDELLDAIIADEEKHNEKRDKNR